MRTIKITGIIIIGFCLLAFTNFSFQTSNSITGEWYWESSNGTNNLELYLIHTNNSVSGSHCSAFYSGSKIDCAEGNDITIQLYVTTDNVFSGTLKSTFSDVDIPIKITYNPATDTIFLEQLSQPTEEYYLPNNTTLTKTN